MLTELLVYTWGNSIADAMGRQKKTRGNQIDVTVWHRWCVQNELTQAWLEFQPVKSQKALHD